MRRSIESVVGRVMTVAAKTETVDYLSFTDLKRYRCRPGLIIVRRLDWTPYHYVIIVSDEVKYFLWKFVCRLT